MPQRLATAAIITLSLAAGACSSTSQRPTPLPASTLPAAGAPSAQPGPVAGGLGQPRAVAAGGGSCNASAASFVVGELGTSVASDQAKEATGAASVRILYPNQPVTQEYVGDRLNLVTDEENRITTVRCG